MKNGFDCIVHRHVASRGKPERDYPADWLGMGESTPILLDMPYVVGSVEIHKIHFGGCVSGLWFSRLGAHNAGEMCRGRRGRLGDV